MVHLAAAQGLCITYDCSPDNNCNCAAQDWDAIAKKDNLNEMSMELRRLEAMVKEIHEEMLFLRTREEEMRDLNGEQTTTNRGMCWPADPPGKHMRFDMV